MADLENSINPTQSTESESPIITPESTIEIDTSSLPQENMVESQENSAIKEDLSQQASSEMNLNDSEITETPVYQNPPTENIPQIFQEVDSTNEYADNNLGTNNPLENTVTYNATQTYAENPIDIPTPENLGNVEAASNTDSTQTGNTVNTNIELNQNSQSSQKEKLAQLIKLREKKAKKVGFSRGILTGVIFTIGLGAISIVFAKDQIMNLINNSDNLLENESGMTASITDLIEDTNEESIAEEENTIEAEDITDEDNYYDSTLIKEEYLQQIDKILSMGYNEVAIEQLNLILKDIQGNENPDEELITFIYKTIDDIENSLKTDETENNIDSESIEDSNNTDNTETEDDKNTEEDDSTTSENDINGTDETEIKFTHVDNVEDANRVISPNCNALNCGDYTKTDSENIILCKDFKLKADMDDSSHRIGSSGVCRYKDSSELVHLDF